MKIVVCTRTLNELRHIESFIDGYSFADQIIVSDGGSLDCTVKKLREY